MSTRKLLVTGASGFVGGFLLERLQQEEAVSIVALHHRDLEEDPVTPRNPDLVWHKADLTHDNLGPLVSGVDTVFHLAAAFSLSEKESDREHLQRVNVEGTRLLAKACKAAGTRHFLFVSSIAAQEATTFYGKTKREAEDLLLSIAGDDFNVTILRTTALFGEHHQGSLFELARAIQEGRFAIFGKGDNWVNFYYIKDFVEALVLVSENPKAFGKVLIASDTPYTLRDLSNTVAELISYKKALPRYPMLLGRLLAAVCDGVNFLTGASLPLSTRRFRAMTRDHPITGQSLYQVLGTTPHYGLKEGLKNTVDYYRSAGLLE